MSTFSGLNGALSSLYAQRRGLDVAGQNIANANTEGYTRQRVNMAAVGPSPIPAMYATPDGSASGVTVTDVTRVRDTYLEARGRIEHAQNEYLAGQSRVYGLVQKAFGEPGDNGLQAQLSRLLATRGTTWRTRPATRRPAPRSSRSARPCPAPCAAPTRTSRRSTTAPASRCRRPSTTSTPPPSRSPSSTRRS